MQLTQLTQPFNAATVLAGSHRPDFDVIASWIPRGAHVLDLGCGEGTLLNKLLTERAVTGYGVEKNDANVATCVAKGLPVLQQDLESGLAWFDDDSFDVAVLSLTLQAVHQTENIMREIVRVGKKAIVSVPNFGFWQHRLAVMRGRMPVSKTLPYEWYNTPNVRVLTLKDFEILARDVGCKITRRVVLHDEQVVSFLPNLRGSLAVFEMQ
jgi:methionine biosynthesis protein MetW